MMHFSDADGDRFGQQGINYQITAFEEIVKDLPGERSVSNSAAILRYQDQLNQIMPVAASCFMAAHQITRPIVLRIGAYNRPELTH